MTLNNCEATTQYEFNAIDDILLFSYFNDLIFSMKFYSAFKFFFLNPNVSSVIFIEHYLNLNGSYSLYSMDLCYTIYFKQSVFSRKYKFNLFFNLWYK